MDAMRGIFFGFDIIGAGLRTEMQRSEVVAANIGNMHVTRGPDGLPWRRLVASVNEARPESFLAALQGQGGARVDGGAHVVEVTKDTVTPFIPRHDPGHPHADENGYVLMSNVDLFKEMVDMAVIQRSFEANLATMRAYRGMLQAAVNNMRA